MTQIPVLFRAERSGQFKNELTAVFPTLPANPGMMVCYAHIGQHTEGSVGWYNGTRAAKPSEYESLLRELRGIYDTDGDSLKVMSRRNAKES